MKKLALLTVLVPAVALAAPVPVHKGEVAFDPAGSYRGFASGSAEAREILQSHNDARAAVVSPTPLAPLTWDDDLAKSAAWWAQQQVTRDEMFHSCTDYANAECPKWRQRPASGENIAQGWTLNRDNSMKANNRKGIDMPYAMSEGWVSERQFFVPATQTGNGRGVIGHYTQVVWRKTTRVGCGEAINAKNGKIFLVCQYADAGNVWGQKPY